MKVFVTGATGLIGRRLCKALQDRGDEVLQLTRQKTDAPSANNKIQGDPSVAGDWLSKMDDCDAVLHLAGENIFAKRWNENFKEKIHLSRTVSTALIAEHLAKKAGRCKTFISASAIGYYGNTGEESSNSVSEDSLPGQGFMADSCVAWEKAADPARSVLRVVHPRISIVLDREGGALKNLQTPFRLFVGGPVGNGQQWMSWIHHEDLTRLFLHFLDNTTIVGPVNCVAPNPVRNKEFCKALGKSLKRPSWLPVPKIVLRIVLGEVANVVSEGQNVKSTKLGQFKFNKLTIDEALSAIYSVE